jgi:hypothetical protein
MQPAARDAVRALVAGAIVVVVATFVLADVSGAYRRTGNQIGQNHGIPSRERRIQGAFGLQISRIFLVRARAFIAPGETYALEYGPDLQGLPAPVITALPAFAFYALLPNRTAPVSSATWLLCYGCDSSKLARDAPVVWRDGGLLIARLRP